MLKRARLLAPIQGAGIGRPRLMRLLEGWHRVTLLAAPAGFGKSTLASAWLFGRQGWQGWLSLEPPDRDGPGLWLHLIACLRQARPDFGSALVPLLASETAVTPHIVERLVEDMADWHQDVPGHRLHLVLDDLHCLDDGTNLPLLLDFLALVQDFIRVVVTCRSAAFLARCTRLGPASLDLIDQHQLAFDASEVDALAEASGVPLTPAMRDRLLARTEGWVTPVQMILGQMRANPTVQVWHDAWFDGHAFALAPLIREHYNSQPATVRTLLCALALAQSFDQQLVTALGALAPATEAAAAQDCIHTDSFIIRLHQPGWWKIHDLYRAHLLTVLAALEPGEQERLVTIVADWHCRSGAHLKALELMQQYAGSAQLHAHLLQHYHHWLQWGMADVLGRAAGLLTPQQIGADPRLCLLYLWARSDQMELSTCQAHLAQAAVQADQQPNQQAGRCDLLSEICSLASYCAQVKGEPALAMQEALRALQLSQQAQRPFRSRALLTIGVLTYMQGHMGEASAALSRALVSAQEERYHYFVVLALGYWVGVLHQAGQLDEALSIYARTRHWLIEVAGNDPVTDLWLTVPPLDIIIARGDMDDARSSLKPLLQFADHATPSLRTAVIYFRAVRFHYYNGDSHTSLEYLSRVEAALEKLVLNWTWGWAPVAAWRRKIALRQNRRQELLHWYQQHPIPLGDGVSLREAIPFHAEEERLLDADVLSQIGLLDQAEALATAIAANAATQERIFNRLLALIVLGNIAYLRDPQGPNGFASEAETLARRMGAHRTLQVEARWQQRGTASQRQDETVVSTALAHTDFISKRERDVLLLVAQGKTDKEIAAALHISFNTAKTHMKNILRKLEAKNRTEALVSARARGIL